MKKALAILSLAAFAAAAAGVTGFAHWPASETKATIAKLKAQAAGKSVATQNLADYGNHSLMTAYRTADGEAEVHEKTVDHFIVQAGEAQLQVGGTVIEPKTTGPGEIRGKAIQGGEIVTMKPGDILHIPANTPHQVLVKKGEFVYSVIKVKQ